MRTFRYDKLVRDKIIPEMILEGSKVVWRKLNDKEYPIELAKKLQEEMDELEEAAGKDRERDLKELADVAEIYELAYELLDHDQYYQVLESAMEMLENIIDLWEIDAKELLDAKVAKIKRMGAFKGRSYLEQVSVNETNPWMQRYIASPDKYPEIK
jgi:predicted house-cleaning noncanonical NTP pyrophosphatase (MazG superfamily)